MPLVAKGCIVRYYGSECDAALSNTMAAKVIDLNSAEDPRDVVHLAVQALAEGGLVVFPTETVYGIAASALNAEAVERLLQAKGRRSGHAVALAVKSAEDALDYVPDLPPLAQRLARRCWPGPITLVLDDKHPESAIRQLPPPVQQAVSPNGTVGLRVPAHPVIQSVMRLTPGPLVLSSANRSGQPDAISAEQVIEPLGERVDLILDDGRSKYGQPSSVVRVENDRWKMLRQGVITEDVLRRLSTLMILLVCTGNTCRSPMAEHLLKRRIAEKLGCTIDELEERGVMIQSAGVAAGLGGRCSPEAFEVMKQWGLDLSGHATQPVSERLIRFADLILTMTKAHREAIVAQWPEAAPRTKLLCRDESDVSDPIGGPLEAYRRCAEQIDAQLQQWVDEIPLPAPKQDE